MRTFVGCQNFPLTARRVINVIKTYYNDSLTESSSNVTDNVYAMWLRDLFFFSIISPIIFKFFEINNLN